MCGRITIACTSRITVRVSVVQWFRSEKNKGGDNIGFLREYMDMSFIDAVEALTGEHIDRTYTPSRTYESKPVQQTARELSLARS